MLLFLINGFHQSEVLITPGTYFLIMPVNVNTRVPPFCEKEQPVKGRNFEIQGLS